MTWLKHWKILAPFMGLEIMLMTIIAAIAGHVWSGWIWIALSIFGFICSLRGATIHRIREEEMRKP